MVQLPPIDDLMERARSAAAILNDAMRHLARRRYDTVMERGTDGGIEVIKKLTFISNVALD